jgi:hypothetical protein
MLILPLSTPSSGGGLPPGVTSPGDGALNYVTGALAASRPSINVAQTWNNAAVPFDADLVDITNTASAASSTVIRRRVGGVDVFRVLRSGALFSKFAVVNDADVQGVQLSYYQPGVGVGSSGAFGWFSGVVGSGGYETAFYRDIANTVNLRGGVNAQTFRLERAYTDGSNRGYTDFAQDAAGGVRLNSVWTGSVAAPTALLDVQANGASNFTVSTSGISNAGSKGAWLGGVYLNYGAGQSVIGWPGSPAWGGVLGLNMYTNGTSNGMVSWNGDAAIVRSAAGALEVNSGTFGQFRDLKLRDLYLGTAAAAGTITPTHTMTIYANGVAYKVPCVAA